MVSLVPAGNYSHLTTHLANMRILRSADASQAVPG